MYSVPKPRGGAATLAAPAPTPTSFNGRGFQGAMEASDQNAHNWTPWVAVAFVALYLLWAVVEQHQRLKSQVQPKNIAVNLRNLAAIGVMVVLFYALARVGLVKLRLLLTWVGSKLGDSFLGIVVAYLVDFTSALIKVVG